MIRIFIYLPIFSIKNKTGYNKNKKTFVKIPESWKDVKLDNKWKDLFKIKQEANVAIEEKRANKEIGSSLEAEIEIFVNTNEYNLLDGLDLAEYFITSKAQKFKNEKKEEGIKILVKKSNGTKCPRCWKIIQNKCTRCDEVQKFLQ